MADFIKLVQPQWRRDFIEYIKTGEGSEAFLAYLEHDEAADRAADMAVRFIIATMARH